MPHLLEGVFSRVAVLFPGVLVRGLMGPNVAVVRDFGASGQHLLVELRTREWAAEGCTHQRDATLQVAHLRDRREAVNIATRLYRQGLDDFLSVLDAERSLYAANDKLAQSDRDTALALVALYKALDGGRLAGDTP
jgi:hypothetical protein